MSVRGLGNRAAGVKADVMVRRASAGQRKSRLAYALSRKDFSEGLRISRGFSTKQS